MQNATPVGIAEGQVIIVIRPFTIGQFKQSRSGISVGQCKGKCLSR
jgi:hypothetical protein